MEVPATLNDYFTVVDDFFRKTFRDDVRLFMALKSRQYSESILGDNIFAAGADAASATAPVSRAEAVRSSASESSLQRNYLLISPRMILRRDGSALGKVKVAYEFDVPRICRMQQGLTLTSNGVVASTSKFEKLMDGLTAAVGFSANTIAPPTQDVTTGRLHYQRGDKYASLGYQRNGFGSSNIVVDCGITFFNLLLGGGLERQRLSYAEHRDGPEQFGVMYVGTGFTGVNWSIAAKLTRSSDAWSNARLSMLQRLSATTAVACNYQFDLAASVAKVSVGCTQGIQLRLPAMVSSSSKPATAPESMSPGWTTPVPLVLACKAESDGLCCATIRGLFHNTIRWGFIVQKNMLVETSPVRYGFTLTMEYAS